VSWALWNSSLLHLQLVDGCLDLVQCCGHIVVADTVAVVYALRSVPILLPAYWWCSTAVSRLGRLLMDRGIRGLSPMQDWFQLTWLRSRLASLVGGQPLIERRHIRLKGLMLFGRFAVGSYNHLLRSLMSVIVAYYFLARGQTASSFRRSRSLKKVSALGLEILFWFGIAAVHIKLG